MIFAFVLLALAMTFALSGGDSDPVEPIEGTEGDDELAGGGADDLIHGLGGDDILRDGGGEDTLLGGDGDDRLYSNLGDDRLDGGSGNDTLQSWNGRDTLLGGDGDDLLLAESAAETLAEGGAGDDELHWIAGEGTMRGGLGDDTIRLGGYSNRTLADGLVEGGEGRDLLGLYGVQGEVDIVFTDDGGGTLTDGSASVAFTGIEEIDLPYFLSRVDASASDTAVTIIGNREDSRFGTGYSTITGGGGDDHLIDGTVMDGGDGDDLLERTNGDGTLTGGAGDDLFAVVHNRGYDGYGMGTVSSTTRITDFTPGGDRVELVVNYDEHFVDPDGRVYDNAPPVVTIVEDLDANETRVMVNNSAAVVLQGVTGVDPASIDVEIRAY